jgi:DNA-binding HxlR family transcriptional regulator
MTTQHEPAQAHRPQQALAAALEHVGDRWSLLVVDALLAGPRRYGELQTDVDGIATNVLSQRLKQLERAGVVVSRPYSTRPPRYAYELTAAGHELAGALRLLSQWGADRMGADAGGGPTHGTCGTSLEARWYCPTCDRVVERGADELHFL